MLSQYRTSQQWHYGAGNSAVLKHHNRVDPQRSVVEHARSGDEKLDVAPNEAQFKELLDEAASLEQAE